jgi:Ca2+-dependent lipid-binding protein
LVNNNRPATSSEKEQEPDSPALKPTIQQQLNKNRLIGNRNVTSAKQEKSKEDDEELKLNTTPSNLDNDYNSKPMQTPNLARKLGG